MNDATMNLSACCKCAIETAIAHREAEKSALVLGEAYERAEKNKAAKRAELDEAMKTAASQSGVQAARDALQWAAELFGAACVALKVAHNKYDLAKAHLEYLDKVRNQAAADLREVAISDANFNKKKGECHE